MPAITQLGFFTRALPRQQGILVRRRGMRLIAALLSVKVYRRVARISENFLPVPSQGVRGAPRPRTTPWSTGRTAHSAAAGPDGAADPNLVTRCQQVGRLAGRLAVWNPTGLAGLRVGDHGARVAHKPDWSR